MHNLHTFNIAKMSKVLKRHFVVCMKPILSKNKLFLRRRFLILKMQEGENLLAHINMVKALADQLLSIEVKIEDEDVHGTSHYWK